MDSSPKNENSVINYSPSCHCKPVRPSFIFGTQIKIFFYYPYRPQHNCNVLRSRNIASSSVKIVNLSSGVQTFYEARRKTKIMTLLNNYSLPHPGIIHDAYTTQKCFSYVCNITAGHMDNFTNVFNTFLDLGCVTVYGVSESSRISS